MFKYKIKIFYLLLAIIFPSQLSAQYVDFGRNKVQYNNFDWHTLSTDHFKVFFYPEMKELAEIGAAYAEESYKIHQQNFNYSLVDTVPLIFYSSSLHFKETNTTPGFIPDGVGGFFEFVKGRVVIPFDGSLGNFKHVIRHELCHVFMTAKISNVLTTHRQTDKQVPLWFTEGLAEFWSTEWDATAEMVIKDAVLNGYMYGLDNWENYYGTFLMYKLGQKALEYIDYKFGHEKILLLIENCWMDDDFSEVMKATIGKDYYEFDKDWLYYLKKQYFTTLTKDDDPSANTETIFDEAFGYKPAYFYNEGKEEIYFIGNKTGYTCIYKINLQNKKAELVIEGEKTEELEEFHFFRSGLDISKKGLLTFVTKKGATDAIHIFNIKSNKLLNNYSFKNIVQIGSPVFSQEGNIIAFSGIDMSGKADLYLFNLTEKKLTRLTNDYYDDRDVDFSPDGKKLVFSSDRTAYGVKNKYNLFIYNLDNNDIKYLTNGDQIDYSPQYSEDGTKIVYTSTQDGAQNIWYIDLKDFTINEGDSLSPQKKPTTIRLTNYTTAAFDPRWVGKNSIIFSTYEKGSIGIRLIEDAKELIDTPVSITNIDYSKINEHWYSNRINALPKRNELRYKKEYSFDLAMSNLSADPVFGVHAGGIIALSDLLSNDQYYFLLFNNAESGDEFFKSFNIAISRVSLEHRLNYAYGIFHLSGVKYDYGDNFPYYERNFGGYFALSYPLSFFRRIDASISLQNSKKDVSEETINRRALLLTNTISYVKDNTIWGPTGPLDGERLNLTLGYTTDIQFSNVNYFSVLIDYRKYLRLSQSVALAGRIEFLMNEGKEARRWVLGGSWDLRGYPRFSIRGKKLLFGSLELRFPLINLATIQFPYDVRFDFPNIRGAVFFDAGNAWDKEYNGVLGSIGIGARLNFYNILAFRYDFGKRIENNFKNFQDGFFSEFFIGWDF